MADRHLNFPVNRNYQHKGGQGRQQQERGTMTARKPATSKAQEPPPAGAGAVPMRGDYYSIKPGPDENSPEYFPAAGLAELGAAQTRLIYLSADGSTQQMSVHRTGHRPKVVFEYSGGRCTLRPACIIPAQPAPVRSTP